MTNDKPPSAIDLSDVSPSVSAQLGVPNVGTIQPTFQLSINISRSSSANASPSSDKTKGADPSSSESPSIPAPSSSDRRRFPHAGERPVHREKISGKWYTLVYPSPNGAYRVVFTKTQTAFTLAPLSVPGDTKPRDDKSEQQSTIQEVDGYRFTFSPFRPINHKQIDRFNLATGTDIASLAGRLLEIYRAGLGKEYFLLTNYYFIDPPSEKTIQAHLPDSEQPLPEANERGYVRSATDAASSSDLSKRSLEIELKSKKKVITKRTFCLDDPPVKLGDGSFGIVYQVREVLGNPSISSGSDDTYPSNATRDGLGTRYAIKIFYNRQMMTRTGLIRVEPSTFNELVSSKSAQIKHVTEMSIGDLLDHLFAAVRKDQNPDRAEKQMREILQQSEKLQNISAKRFGRERDISANIRAVLDRYPRVNASEIACVQTAYDTTQFRASSMFQFLRKHEQNKGASTVDNLSNYAIVMEWCDATLEDVLEGHWWIWGKTPNNTLQRAVEAAKHLESRPAPHRKTVYYAQPAIPERDPPEAADRQTAVDGTLPDRPNDHAKDVTGYGMLKCLPFVDRVAITHPFMVGLAEALQMLHITRNYHHDIKPGNVFVKKSIHNFNITLGDFSFVGSGVDEGTTEAVLRDSIQTGSLHFRSPEQRDFNDAAYGIVRHSECCDGPGDEYPDEPNGVGKNWAYVRILDPKFRGSTIATNDIVVFPADRNGIGYRVSEVHIREKFKDVWLNVDPNEFKTLFPEETRTKVFLYKIPTVRSDLFGLGAVYFDLITGGESAERFYEALRPFDIPMDKNRKGDDGDAVHARRHSAKDIRVQFEKFRKYRGSTNGPNVEAALLNMFQFFRDEDDFAPAEIVEIIVKLMGAHLTDSYFNTNPKDRGVPEYLTKVDSSSLPVSWALEDIRDIAKTDIYDWREQQSQLGMDNLLFRPQESQHFLARIAERLDAIEGRSTDVDETKDATDEDGVAPVERRSFGRWILEMIR